MLEKVQLIEQHYEEINEKLMDPNVVNDQAAYRDLMREYKNLTPIVEKYRKYKKAEFDLEEVKSLLDVGGLDKDFKEMLEEEYASTSNFAIEQHIYRPLNKLSYSIFNDWNNNVIYSVFLY